MAKRSKFSQQELSPHLSGSLFSPTKKRRTEQPTSSFRDRLGDSRDLLDNLTREFSNTVDNTFGSADFLKEMPETSTTKMGMGS